MHLRELVNSLPPPNKETLKKLLEFLHKVEQYSEKNKMDAFNLATMFGPNILRCADNSPQIMLRDSLAVSIVTQTMIQNCLEIFQAEYFEDVTRNRSNSFTDLKSMRKPSDDSALALKNFDIKQFRSGPLSGRDPVRIQEMDHPQDNARKKEANETTPAITVPELPPPFSLHTRSEGALNQFASDLDKNSTHSKEETKKTRKEKKEKRQKEKKEKKHKGEKKEKKEKRTHSPEKVLELYQDTEKHNLNRSRSKTAGAVLEVFHNRSAAKEEENQENINSDESMNLDLTEENYPFVDPILRQLILTLNDKGKKKNYQTELKCLQKDSKLLEFSIEMVVHQWSKICWKKVTNRPLVKLMFMLLPLQSKNG